MIVVQVRVANGMHEIADVQPACLRHHLREQRVAGDIEWQAEEDVRGALV